MDRSSVKIDVKELYEKSKEQQAKIFEVLKEGASEELKQKDISPKRMKKLNLLLTQDEMLFDINAWGPTDATMSKLVELGLIEDSGPTEYSFASNEPKLTPYGQAIYDSTMEFVKYLLLEGEYEQAIKFREDFKIELIEERNSDFKKQKRIAKLSGDIWAIKFKEEWIYTADRERTRYLIHLLQRPNRSFSSPELIQLVKGINIEVNEEYSSAIRRTRDYETDDINGISVDGENNKEDFNQIKNTTLDTWDNYLMFETDEAHQEWERWKVHIFEEYGIIAHVISDEVRFSHKRKLTNDLEKARINATKHIKGAIKDFKDKHQPLYDHLTRNIKTGASHTYNQDPENDDEWFTVF